MDNYVISDEEEVIDAEPQFPDEYMKGVKIMKIKKNTKFGHIVDHILKEFEDDSKRYVVCEGVGDAADKCISCVEVLKRKFKDSLYQWNKLNIARRVTYWDPIIEGLDRLRVTVDVPVMHILISRDAFSLELQCLSMQTSDVTNIPKKNYPSDHRSRRGGASRGAGQSTSKWSRPEKKKQNVERNKELAELERSLKLTEQTAALPPG